MTVFGSWSPAVYQALDLACGLASLLYCIMSALIVLQGFLLKRAVSMRHIDRVATAGAVSTALYLAMLVLSGIGLNIWSLLNLCSNLTFLLFYKSRKKPRMAVYALYVQAVVYMAFVMRLITTRMNVSMLVSFVVFQLIPAVLLIGMAIIILFQTVREHRSGPEENAFFPDEEPPEEAHARSAPAEEMPSRQPEDTGE